MIGPNSNPRSRPTAIDCSSQVDQQRGDLERPDGALDRDLAAAGEGDPRRRQGCRVGEFEIEAGHLAHVGDQARDDPAARPAVADPQILEAELESVEHVGGAGERDDDPGVDPADHEFGLFAAGVDGTEADVDD